MSRDESVLAPPPPDSLGSRGATFWRSVQDVSEFDFRETDLLLEICRTLDTIEALSTAIDRDGVMIVGSQGQMVMNNAIGERRLQQAAYARMVTQLNLTRGY